MKTTLIWPEGNYILQAGGCVLCSLSFALATKKGSPSGVESTGNSVYKVLFKITSTENP